MRTEEEAQQDIDPSSIKAQLEREIEAKEEPPLKGEGIKRTPPAPIPMDSRKQLAPKDNSQLQRMIEQIAVGGGFPKRFSKPAERLAAYNLGRSLMGEKWQLALNNIASVHGQMIVFGELPKAMAEQTKDVQEFKVFVIDKDYNEICFSNKNIDTEPWAGVCIVQRKGREKKEYSYTIEEARRAGQYPATKWNKGGTEKIPNEDSPWMKYTKIMLMRKAQAIGVKFEFPDAMVGAVIAEHDLDVAPDLEEITKDVTPTEDLNKRYLGEETQVS